MNIFETPKLIAAVKKVNTPTSFLRDRYFPTNESSDVFATTEVAVEYKDGEKTVAPFVAPRQGGVTMEREGYELTTYTPPMVAPKRNLTLDDLERKGFGEALMTDLTPEQRAAAVTLSDAVELGEMITRREEVMAAEVMQTNACIMKHIADDKSKFDEKVIKFYSESRNPATYTPTGNWDKGYTGVMKDLNLMRQALTKRGLPASDLIVGSDVAEALLANTEIQRLMDLRNFDIGRVMPEALPDSVSLIAVLNIGGHDIKVFHYEEEYKHPETGEITPYIDPKNAIMTAPGAGKTLYGAVHQMEADGEFHTRVGRRIPKVLNNVASNSRDMIVTACPLLMPVAKNPFITAKVLA